MFLSIFFLVFFDDMVEYVNGDVFVDFGFFGFVFRVFRNVNDVVVIDFLVVGFGDKGFDFGFVVEIEVVFEDVDIDFMEGEIDELGDFDVDDFFEIFNVGGEVCVDIVVFEGGLEVVVFGVFEVVVECFKFGDSFGEVGRGVWVGVGV